MSAQKPEVEVCISPDLLPLFQLEGKAVVVADILRATSCMVTALAHGVAGIIPVAKIEDCKQLQQKGLKAAAERDGSKVPGFDLDNSPFSYMDTALQQTTIAVTTTNGTQAIDRSAGAAHVFVGAFLNLEALAQQLKKLQTPVVIVCAGWKGNCCIEDTLFAGALVSRLQPAFECQQDAAVMAHSLFQTHKNKLLSFVQNAQHTRRLFKLNIVKDIEFCLTFDLYTTVPRMQNGVLKAVE